MTNWVRISARAEKSLRKVPRVIAAGFFTWRRDVETHGIEETRKIPGYHDEPLKGKLKGRIRSVRLGNAYRAYYRIISDEVKYIWVEEVNRHDYKEIERLLGL